ncbi:hypothetical protein TTHERM_00522820 (macronuclear) [Tetrahymena thermophila SB210]|uniref:Uncharacterized protein n=1 Tax=Tetrahymena thermophila (strain SB210) TaxID=312017 RepID=I7MIS5_TETTS|nr:hypothetical protein TTHERM_00522820 [Tetrahymena thermophila SB210]EAR94215.2 hypothetical protein TTHERM_00522820 [Tetrahymena thermophila SB210]|eukprot:XP_001014460.2 hypothetical protein TTHERM_00522820 [Tetrahymena thermophila SB210]
MDKDSTFSSEKSLIDNVQVKIDEFKKQQGHLDRYHEKYRLAKKLIKEWGNLLKKTKQGAQKIVETQLKNMDICYEDEESINGINQILNLVKDMINIFSAKIGLYENELLKQHLILKEQGSKLYQINKQVKDSYKTEKEFYDQITKKFQDQQCKIVKNSFIKFRMTETFQEQNSKNDKSVSNGSTSLLQTNQSYMNTTANSFNLVLEMFKCEIEKQMIMSCNKCIQSILSITNVMKPFEFESLKSQIPNFIIERNKMQLEVIDEFLKRSRASKEINSKMISQNQLTHSFCYQNFKEFSQQFQSTSFQKKQKESRFYNHDQAIANKSPFSLYETNFNPFSQNADIEQSNVEKISVLQNMQINKLKEKNELQISEKQSLAQSEIKYNQTPQKQNLNTSKESKQKFNQASNQQSNSPYCKEFQFTVHQSDRQNDSSKDQKTNLKRQQENKQNSELHKQE